MATKIRQTPHMNNTPVVRSIDPQKLQKAHDRELKKLRELARVQREELQTPPRNKMLRYFGFV